MKKSFIILVLSVIHFFAYAGKTEELNLSGTWRFATDPQDRGVSESWFKRTLSETVNLPGSMTTNGKGQDISLKTIWTGEILDSAYFKSPEYAPYRVPENMKVPFWLQPVKSYVGAAWYQKEIFVPRNWEGKSIELLLERCHWETRVWVDSSYAGMRNSLGTAHVYRLDRLLSPGKHTLTICVDNREKNIEVGKNSHSISDHTQTNWNGIVGSIRLTTRPAVFVRSIQIYPDIHKKNILAVVRVDRPIGKNIHTDLSICVQGKRLKINKAVHRLLSDSADTIQVIIQMGNQALLWSEFQPALYTLTATLTVPDQKKPDFFSTVFGMREISVQGKHLLLNDKPMFLRGTLECAIFPKTGYPPTDTASWMRIFKICKAHGLNHVRFHSWCPPREAFEAADHAGIYLQVECSSWANHTTTVGDGKPLDGYLYEESERMVEAYGNHPSFCIMLYGNEPGGKYREAYLRNFVCYWKARDHRRIYSSGAGWPNLAVNDFLSTPKPRIQRWGEELNSIINKQPPASDYDWTCYTDDYTQPVVSHEIGQWCVYPNFKEISKYTGVVRAKNFEIFKTSLEKNGMAALADSFLLASGKLQALCYKADIEAALRTKDFGGFQLLDLHDFPGQGTALVGVLDPFWDEKGYISPTEYSRFCGPTIPLARMKQFFYRNTDTLRARVEVAHYGADVLKDCVPLWTLNDKDGSVVASGKLPKRDVVLGNCIGLGEIAVPLEKINTASQLSLQVTVAGHSNDWDIWVYPQQKMVLPAMEKIRLVSCLDDSTLSELDRGGMAILSIKKGTLRKDYGGTVAIGFSSIFWNTAWTRKQAPHTLGVLCNPAHPALAEFPSEYHSNWQWWDACSHSGAIMLSRLSPDIQPIVRVIDDWFTNRSLGLIFEVRIGKGKLLISGIDFFDHMDQRLEAEQLLYSLQKYMTGPYFNPQVKVDAAVVKDMIMND